MKNTFQLIEGIFFWKRLDTFLINTGLKKYVCQYTMEEPVLSDHSSSGSSKKSKSSSSSSKHSSKSSKSGSPEGRASRDTPPDILQSDDNLALEILEDDLTCVICKGMDVGARNRLVECVDCHSLYHQECHNPPIQDSQIDVPRLIWYCSNCLKSHQASIFINFHPRSTKLLFLPYRAR